MKSKTSIVFSLALLLTPLCANAGILWQQLPTTTQGWINQEFPDFTEFSSYAVNDVSTGGNSWHVTSITEYFTDNGGLWPSSMNVRLNIFNKTGSSPSASDDPTAGSVYSATLTTVGVNNEIKITGLSIDLAPGDYWIGFTPILGFNDFGQEFQLMSVPAVGDPTSFRNPGNGFGDGTGWKSDGLFGNGSDLAITIEGDVRSGGAIPEPASLSLFAFGVAGIVYARRRKLTRI